MFYGSFVDEAIMAADERAGTDMPVLGGATSAAYGYTAAAAAQITVPVFVGLGEEDLSPAPHREPDAYHASTDITLFILGRSAHCHNLAPTRAKLWTRLAEWLESEDQVVRTPSFA